MQYIGSDEVGWGSVAGPLFVVGVSMPREWNLANLRDSKKLTRKQREELFEPLIDEIRGNWSLATYSAQEIDRRGAQACLIEAHTRVLQTLLAKVPENEPRFVVLDGEMHLPALREAVAIPKADAIIQVVAAASVVAKVLHDGLMLELSNHYPQYALDSNMGYETADHAKALKKYGLCPVHRKSYLSKYLR